MSKENELIKLGLRIRELRKKKKLAQHELAVLCNFEKGYMSKIESGKINATVVTLLRVNKALNVSLEELFRDV